MSRPKPTFAIFKERAEACGITREELDIVGRARNIAMRRVLVGGMGGLAAGLFFARRRGFKGPGMTLTTIAGSMFGAQLGLYAGAQAAIEELKKLPDPQKFVRLAKDIRDELISNRRRPQHGVDAIENHEAQAQGEFSGRMGQSDGEDEPAARGTRWDKLRAMRANRSRKHDAEEIPGTPADGGSAKKSRTNQYGDPIDDEEA